MRVDPFLTPEAVRCWGGLGDIHPAGGTLFNRIVFPPKDPTMSLAATWEITMGDDTEPAPCDTMVQQAMNSFTEEDDPV